MMQDKGYKIIRNFLSQDQLSYCTKKFQKLPISIMDLDKYGPSVYNFPVFLEILCNNLNKVSQLVNEPLLPTYCYARKYQKGAILPPHVDRPSCEVSVTFHLYGDESWKFYLLDRKNKEVMIDLDPGDAVCYLGMDLSHWRKEYTGNEYAQVFLHYVKSRGQYKDYYFDNKLNQDRKKLLGLSQRYKKRD